MFIFSIKLSKLLKRISIGCAVVIVIVFVFNVGVDLISNNNQNNENKIEVNANSVEYNDFRTQFLQSKNLSIITKPMQVSEVLVPEKIEGDYEQYNIIQLKQGFDMRKFKGKKLKQWVYKIDQKPNSYVYVMVDNNQVVGCHVVDENNNKMTIEDFLKK